MKRDPADEHVLQARRFVVLFHACREGDHYDLMIENGEKLATWKMDVPPEQANRELLRVQRIGEHRRLYLYYEGPISGNRGDVRQHDSGHCYVITDERGWRIRFDGKRISGLFDLAASTQFEGHWELRRLRE